MNGIYKVFTKSPIDVHCHRHREKILGLRNEAKIQISRQPKYDIHDEIRNLRDEIKKKNDKIIVLSTESSVYQIESNKAKKIIEGMNEELNLVKQIKYTRIHISKIIKFSYLISFRLNRNFWK